MSPAVIASGFADLREDLKHDWTWHVLSVYPRHEKQVAQMCGARDVRYLLPLYPSLRRWKDRRKQVDMVLFPGYVFVQIAPRQRGHVLSFPGVARFVAFRGEPAVVPELEIAALSNGMGSGLPLQPHPYLQEGRPVRMRSGPMTGVEGILVRRKDKCRVVLSIELLMRSVAIEVDEADIEPRM